MSSTRGLLMIGNLVILGPPGSGKGTIAEKISKKYNLDHVSTGDMIREEMKHGNPEILKYVAEVEKGNLLPDLVVLALIKKRFENNGGFVLDGYPRTENQAKLLDDFLGKNKIKVSAVLYLKLNEKTIFERLSARRQCSKCSKIYNLKFMPPKKEGICDKCGGKLYTRADDVPQAIRKRIELYNEMAAPIKSFYRKKKLLHEMSVEKHVSQNFIKIKKLLDSL